MMIDHLEPVFVHVIPEDAQPGFLYISMEFATAIHRCCCGCGHEIVTPFSPVRWSLTFDGETVSLEPSIGNWSLDCQSHYWVIGNRIRWARKFTEPEIAAVRSRRAPSSETETRCGLDTTETDDRPAKWWARISRRHRSKRHQS